MKYKAIIFDLDGTLTNTLTDLAASTNHALACMGMPQRRLDEVRQFVGNGVRRLIERAVPQGTDDASLELCFQHFRQHYLQHCQDNTCLYPGIDKMLEEVHRQGFLTAIVSNKLQSGVDELYHRFFEGKIDVAIGEREGMQRKPAPDMVNLALTQLGVTPSQAIYIGDSDVDIDTARNSGLPCISVLWGFRDRDFLLSHEATILVETPQQILQHVG